MPRDAGPMRPGEGRTDPGVPTRWLFHYHPQMTAAPLLAATPVARMTVGEDFMQAHVKSWAPDLLAFPLLSPEFCRFLVDAGEALGEWGPGAAAVLELDKITARLSDVVTLPVGHALMIPGGPSHGFEALPVDTGTHQLLGFKARPRG